MSTNSMRTGRGLVRWDAGTRR